MSDAVQLLLNGLAAGAAYAMFAVSFVLVYRAVRFVHFAHAGIFTLGPYGAFAVAGLHGGASPALALALGCTLAALAGSLLIGLLLGVVGRGRAKPAVLLVASLGVQIVIQNVIALSFGPGSLTLPWSLDGVLAIGEARVSFIRAAMFVSAIVATCLVHLWLYRTRSGRDLRAACDDADHAGIVGLERSRIILSAVAVASALAGYTGILVGMDSRLRPEMGFQALLIGVVAVVVGGTRGVWGTTAAALSIGVLQQVQSWFFPSKWQDALVFVVLVAFLALRPAGISARAVTQH